MPDAVMSRRSLLATGSGVGLAAALAGIGVLGAACGAERPGERPNFLWCLSEDNLPYNGAYGDDVARTPHIDRLAAEGVLFEVAYSTSPVCAPSRFSFLTGLYPATAGPAHHMRADGKIPEFVRGLPAYLRDAGYYTTNNFKTDFNAGGSTGMEPGEFAAAWHASGRDAHWRNRPDADTPFFGVFTTLANHESMLFDVVDGPTDPAEVRVPEYLPDTWEIRRGIAHSYDRQAEADAELGRLLSELEADGVADDTIVVYCGDNGGALPWSKRFANNNGLHVPLIISVPPKWRHLASARPGERVSSPVNGVDVPPTVLSLAGLDLPDHFQGQVILGARAEPQEYAFGERARTDERYDLQRAVRDERYLYIRNYMPHRPYGQHVSFMWQQPAYQLWEQAHLDGTLDPAQDRFFGAKPYEELYDLVDDPDQVRNLVDEPRFGTIRSRLSQALDEHMLEINDNGFIPETHPVEGYEQSRVRGAYPLEHVMRVARLAAQRKPAHLDLLVHALQHENDIVRYWAATGLLILGEDAGAKSTAVAEAFAGEKSVFVKIPLAEALTRLGDTVHAVEFLGETADAGNDARVRLQALNALTYVGVAALSVKHVVDRAAADDTDEYVRRAGAYLQHVLAGTYTPSAPIGGAAPGG